MITQAETGLSTDDYNALLAARTNPAWSVIAHQFNLLFTEKATGAATGAASGFDGSDFDVVANENYVFRVSGISLVERFDPAMGTWETLTDFAAPSGVKTDICPKLLYEDDTLKVFMLTDTGLYRSESADEGDTFSAWTQIVASADTEFYSEDKCVGGTASADEVATGFPASNVFDDFLTTYWKATTDSAILKYDLGAGNEIAATRYILRSHFIHDKGLPSDILFQGSNNDADWTTLADDDPPTYVLQGGYRTFIREFTNATAYRYYRWFIADTNGGNPDNVIVHEIEISESVTANPIIGFGVTPGERVYWFSRQEDTDSCQFQFLNPDDGARPTTIEWPYIPTGIDATQIDADHDLIVFNSQVPGDKTAVAVGDTTNHYIYLKAGILGIIANRTLIAGAAENSANSDPFPIEIHDDFNSFHFHNPVRVTSFNGLLHLIAFVSTGTENFPVQEYRHYVSRDGYLWSKGDILYPGANRNVYAAKLVAFDNLLYLGERKRLYEAKSTLPFGNAHPDTVDDISLYVDAYSLDRGEIVSANLNLSNADGYFDNHPFIAPGALFGFVHEAGYYLPDETAIQVAVTKADQIHWRFDNPQKVVPLSSRDRFSAVTDHAKSEQARIWDGHLVAVDQFTDNPENGFGGMAHTAIQTGDWSARGNALRFDGVGAATGFVWTTLQTDAWNGLLLVKTITPGGGARGIIFRALDRDNYYLFANQILYEVRGGVKTLLEQYIGAVPDASDDDIYMAVQLEYNRVRIYLNGTSFNFGNPVITHTFDLKSRQYGEPFQRAAGSEPMERGYWGFYAEDQDPNDSLSWGFSNAQLYDRNRPITAEDAFKTCAAYGGMNQFSVDSQYTLADTDWDDDTDLVTDFTDGVYTLDATGEAGAWYKSIQTGVSPTRSALYKFTLGGGVDGDHNAALVISNVTNSNHFLIAAQQDSFRLLQYDGSYTTLCGIPNEDEHRVERADITIAVREFLYQNTPWLSFAAWYNGRFIGAFSVEDDGLLEEEVRFGFAVEGGSVATFEALHIPELTDFLNAITIDPGETPIGAMRRTLQGIRHRFFVRYDETIRLTRQKETAVVLTLDEENDIERDSRYLNLFGLINHVRLLGAYTEAEYADTALIAASEHRFEEINNPSILTERECFQEARRIVKLSESESDLYNFTGSFMPLLEPEDRITTPEGDYVVVAQKWDFTGPQTRQDVTGRKHVT